jgi:peptidoglycan biosynthesis protein MviN/MurJ (putative lipid II flippase)
MVLTAAGLLGDRAWSTVRILIAVCLLNGALDAMLVGPLGIFGLAVATTIATGVKVVLLLGLVLPHWHRSAVIPELASASSLFLTIFALLVSMAQLIIVSLVGDSETFAVRLIQLSVYTSVTAMSFALARRRNGRLAARMDHLRAAVAAGQRAGVAR